jgi:hypothetical protein
MAPSKLIVAVCFVSAAMAAVRRADAAPATVAAMPPSADVEFAREPSWSAPTETEVRRRVLEWLASSSASADVAGRQRDAWAEPAATTAAADDLLDRVMATFVAVDPRSAALRADLDADRSWLDAGVPDFQRDALKLWLGRELVRSDRFDDALPLFTGLDLATAVDPAALLFHRAACQHWLLDADAAVESLDTLLERAGVIPVRYERLARLMRADITALEDESLDHIARRMRDVTRRLDQGRAAAAKASRWKTASWPTARAPATWPAAISATRTAGAICRPTSGTRRCSRSAASFRRTTARRSSSSSSGSPPARRAA